MERCTGRVPGAGGTTAGLSWHLGGPGMWHGHGGTARHALVDSQLVLGTAASLLLLQLGVELLDEEMVGSKRRCRRLRLRLLRLLRLGQAGLGACKGLSRLGTCGGWRKERGKRGVGGDN